MLRLQSINNHGIGIIVERSLVRKEFKDERNLQVTNLVVNIARLLVSTARLVVTLIGMD